MLRAYTAAPCAFIKDPPERTLISMRSSVLTGASGGTVRQGGKEELRASVLKTYLLRMRTERGERPVAQLLAGAGIDPSAVDNETGWVSTLAAKRELDRPSVLLGGDAIPHRGPLCR